MSDSRLLTTCWDAVKIYANQVYFSDAFSDGFKASELCKVVRGFIPSSQSISNPGPTAGSSGINFSRTFTRRPQQRSTPITVVNTTQPLSLANSPGNSAGPIITPVTNTSDGPRRPANSSSLNLLGANGIPLFGPSVPLVSLSRNNAPQPLLRLAGAPNNNTSYSQNHGRQNLFNTPSIQNVYNNPGTQFVYNAPVTQNVFNVYGQAPQLATGQSASFTIGSQHSAYFSGVHLVLIEVINMSLFGWSTRSC